VKKIIIALAVFLPGCAYFAASSLKYKSYVLQLYFPSTKENGSFYATPCVIDSKNGHCILDTGLDKSQIAETPETSQFNIISKVKIVSMYGERIATTVEVPELTLGSDFVRKNFPATRSNSFHDLPEYLAVLGADVLIGTNFIFDFGAGENNPAKLILEPTYHEVAAYQFQEFDTILEDVRFITIRLTIEGKKIKAVWDTHAPVSAFSTRFIEANSKYFKILESRNDKDAHGMNGKQNFYQLLKPVCITAKYCPYAMNYVVEHKLGLIGKEFEDIDAILGNDFILSFNWYFDFKNRKYFAKPR